MKRKVVYIFVCLFSILFYYSCSKEQVRDEKITKRIELTLIGDMDKISPWASFSVDTDDRVKFKYIYDNDSIFVKDGLYKSSAKDFKVKKIVFERDYKYIVSDLHLTIRYLKRTSNPSEDDNLKIMIKAYKNGILYKEENRIMRSYEISDRPSPNEYLYYFIF